MTSAKRWRRVATLVACLTALAAPAAARRSAPTPPPAPAGAADAAEATASPDDTRRAQVLMRLGEVTLTLGELEDDLRRRAPFARRQMRDRARLTTHVREMFDQKLLAHAAAERGYGTNASVRARVDRQLVTRVVRLRVDEPNAPQRVEEAAARAYFAEHPELFVRPEQRRAAHILVESRERAAELLAELRDADLRTFRRTAMTESQDPRSKQRGGDLGYFDAEGHLLGSTEPAIAEPIRNAIFAVSREEPFVNEPVAVPSGDQTLYSVLRLTGLREGANPSFEDVEPMVRRRVAVSQRDASYRALMQELRERHPVQTSNLELLRTITLPPPPMPSHNHRGAERVEEGEGDGHEGE